MDQTRTVGATERTRDAGRTGGRPARQMDGRTEWNQYNPPPPPPPTNSLCRMIMTCHLFGVKPLSEPMLEYINNCHIALPIMFCTFLIHQIKIMKSDKHCKPVRRTDRCRWWNRAFTDIVKKMTIKSHYALSGQAQSKVSHISKGFGYFGCSLPGHCGQYMSIWNIC